MTIPIEYAPASMEQDETGVSLGELLATLAKGWKLLVIGPLATGLIAFGVASLIPPSFTAQTTFMPPQQQQSAAASALSSLGALGGLTAGAAGIKSPGEQYVALMQSVTVSDRIVDWFKLMEVYDEQFRVDARKALAKNVRINMGKKDGLITVEVDDRSPARAAEMANRYVDELRRMTSILAVGEAQQRRMFFEQQLKQSRERLVEAQLALQGSGFNASALKAEPKAQAEAFARLRAEVTAAEVKLQAMRTSLADGAPEIRMQMSILTSLRDQLARTNVASTAAEGPDYVSKYREFKYQETLFELYARQFELARVDESREGAMIQVVDVALPPEKKSKPKRGLVAASTALVTGLALMAGLLLRSSGRNVLAKPPELLPA